MKTFQVVNVRWYNATAWYGVTLARLLAEAGHESMVLALPGTEPEARAREMGLPVAALDLNTVNPARFVPVYSRVASLVREHRPDVVNCHRGEGFIVWGLLKRLGYGFRLVRTRGDQRLPKNNPPNRWLHKSVADAVVTTNRRMADHFLKAMRVDERRLWLIRGGVDAESFAFDAQGRARVRAEFGFNAQDMVLGLLGRFDTVKGQRELLGSVARLRDRGMDRIKLLLIGHDSSLDTDTVRRWIGELGLEDAVGITGRREDVAACVSALDLGVVASLWSETIARAALEIMACRRPLVSSDVGVMPDLVGSEALFPAKDPEAMDKTLARAVTDETLLARLRADQERILSQHTHKEFLRRTLRLYESLLETGR
jgi:glycosyltransferase involved in cell wall biosynthesis